MFFYFVLCSLNRTFASDNQILIKKWTTTRRIITIRKARGTAGKTANPLAAKTVFKKGLAQ